MLSLYHLGGEGEGIAVIVSILVAPARSMVLSQVNPPMDNGDIENYAESSSSCTNYCIIYYRISSFAGLDYDSFRCLYMIYNQSMGYLFAYIIRLQDQVTITRRRIIRIYNIYIQESSNCGRMGRRRKRRRRRDHIHLANKIQFHISIAIDNLDNC